MNLNVNCNGFPVMSDDEVKEYLKQGQEKFGGMLEGMDIEVLNEEEVKITYHVATAHPFERIRRITGYLVGTLDKWNNAKRAEEKERVKHDS